MHVHNRGRFTMVGLAATVEWQQHPGSDSHAVNLVLGNKGVREQDVG